MGLFSGKTTTYVSSVVYNLAGDEADQVNLVAATIIGSVLSGNKANISSALTNMNFHGSGTKQRRFFEWAQLNYTLGMPDAVVDGSSIPDKGVVRSGIDSLVTTGPNESIHVTTAYIDSADIDYWAEDWMRINYPNKTYEEWSADFDPASEEFIISIDGPIEERIPASEDFLWGMDRTLSRRLLFVTYSIMTTSATAPFAVNNATQFLVYRIGSGNVVLDNLVTAETAVTEFFPALPLRLSNKSIRHVDFADKLTNVSDAFKKLTGSKIDSMLDSIEDTEANPDLDKIDYIFLVQGVPLNTQDNEAKKYLYTFFRQLQDIQLYNPGQFQSFKEEVQEVKVSTNEWDRWLHGQKEGNDTHPLYATAEPVSKIKFDALPPLSQILITTPETPEFSYRIGWNYVDESQHVGNGKTFDGDLTRGKMKTGDYWFSVGPNEVVNIPLPTPEYETYNTKQYLNKTYTRVYMFHQTSKYSYTRLELVGLEHRNYVYGAHNVYTSAVTSLEDTDITSFLVPLHYPTMKALGIRHNNQMAVASAYLVFNTYDTYKQKWYETGIFKIVLVIVSVILTVLLPPAGIALSGGILGSNLAIGVSLGITSATSAAIAGAAVNAIAGMILTTLISKASISLFGDKWGTILGTIASFVAMTYGTNFAQTGNFNVDWSRTLRIDNMLKLTNSVSDAYTRWLNVDTQDIYAEMENLKEFHADELEKIDKLSEEILGMTNGIFDPMILTEATEHFGESSDEFLSRTLLTGSDLAELTMVLIENFADISLELPMAAG